MGLGDGASQEAASHAGQGWNPRGRYD